MLKKSLASIGVAILLVFGGGAAASAAVGSPEGAEPASTIAADPSVSRQLPDDSGTMPLAAIWLAVGALGIGGIATSAFTARRRVQRLQRPSDATESHGVLLPG